MRTVLVVIVVFRAITASEKQVLACCASSGAEQLIGYKQAEKYSRLPKTNFIPNIYIFMSEIRAII